MVNLQCFIHRESIENEGNMLACCNVFHCLTEWIRGVRRTHRGSETLQGNKHATTTKERQRREVAPLEGDTKEMTESTHWSLSVRHMLVLCVHFAQAALSRAE